MKKQFKKAKKKILAALSALDLWVKKNVLAVLTLALQIILWIRVESLHEKLDSLAAGIAGSLIAIYMAGLSIANDLGSMLMKVIGIVSGDPS